MDRARVYVAATVAMDAVGAGLLLWQGWRLGAWWEAVQVALAVVLVAVAVALLLHARWARIAHVVAAVAFFGTSAGLASSSVAWGFAATAWSFALMALMLSRPLRAWVSAGNAGAEPATSS